MLFYTQSKSCITGLINAKILSSLSNSVTSKTLSSEDPIEDKRDSVPLCICRITNHSSSNYKNFQYVRD